MDARIKSGHDIPWNRRTGMRLLIILAFVLIASGIASAQSIDFQSPSKDIACAYFDTDKQNTLRCDIMEATVTARRPADCDLEWGKAFEMRSKGSSGRLCYGDTIMEPGLPQLAYGEVWQRGGFTCKSEQSGVTWPGDDGLGLRSHAQLMLM